LGDDYNCSRLNYFFIQKSVKVFYGNTGDMLSPVAGTIGQLFTPDFNHSCWEIDEFYRAWQALFL